MFMILGASVGVTSKRVWTSGAL